MRPTVVGFGVHDSMQGSPAYARYILQLGTRPSLSKWPVQLIEQVNNMSSSQ